MKLWLVINDERAVPVGVFSTEEKAREFIAGRQLRLLIMLMDVPEFAEWADEPARVSG